MPTRSTPADGEYMRRALELAARGWGQVHPNPLVGAVVVGEAGIVGEGYHTAYGGPHAEVVALAEAGELARGGTLYVTLEPCAHHGKTPPCTEAVLASGVSRVVIAAEDPNPMAAGGVTRLRQAGLEVVTGVEREAARVQNAAFFHAVERRSPFVVLKYGLSLDARLSAQSGRPTAVTGPESIGEVHRLRAGFDAILIGSGTAAADDPSLTVRGAVTPRVTPVRIVVDSEARLCLYSRMAQTAAETPVWVICALDASMERRRSLEGLGVRTLAAPRAEHGIDLRAALDRLWDEGVRSIFCEGGGRLGMGLLSAGVVARMVLFYAPKLLGDQGAAAFPGAFAPLGPLWSLREACPMGNDTQITLDREW